MKFISKLVSVLFCVTVLVSCIPDFSAGASYDNSFLTEEETEFAENSGIITVALYTNLNTISFLDEKTGEFEGVVPDILDYISERSGLEFNCIPYDMTMRAEDFFRENPECDMVAPIFKNELNSVAPSIKLSSAVIGDDLVFAGKKGTLLSEESSFSVAVPKHFFAVGEGIKRKFPKAEIISCDTKKDAFRMVKKGDADVVVNDRFLMKYDLKSPYYSNIEIVPDIQFENNIVLGASQNTDPLMMSIINKLTDNMTDSEKSQIIVENTMSNTYQVSLAEVCYQYRVYIIIGAILIAFLIILEILFVRLNSAKRKSEFLEEKSKADEKYRHELFVQANYDDLTGIYNSKYFLVKTQEMLDMNPDKYYAMIYINIDNFKLLNRMYGQESCNRLLEFIASDFRKKINSTGTFCRYSSDCFAVCVEMRRVVEERISNLCTSVFNDNGKVINLKYRMGICTDKEKTLNAEQMLEDAQLAFQNISKEYGTNISVFDNELIDKLLMEKTFIDELDAALENGEFQVYLQPQFSHKTKSLIGAEALVRWIHPERGLIPPFKFIPVFEKSGNIVKVDSFVWEQACKIISRWKKEYNIEFPISVNISRNDMYAEDWEKKFLQLTEKYGISPELLHLEITESAYMDNSQLLVEKVKELKNQGFVVAMDDFGSGYSSLNMLQDIDVDILKIDMRFLHSNSNSNSTGNILKAVANMATWLGLAVVTEGVETKEQADFMMSIGCDVIQGYFYGKPVPVEEFEGFFKTAEVTPLTKNLRDSIPEVSFLAGNSDLNGLVESIPVGVKIYDPDKENNFAIANEMFCEIFGITEEQFKKELPSLFMSVCSEDQQLLKDKLATLKNAGDWFSTDIHCFKSTGEKMFIHLMAKVISENVFGKLMNLIAVQDITEYDAAKK